MHINTISLDTDLIDLGEKTCEGKNNFWFSFEQGTLQIRAWLIIPRNKLCVGEGVGGGERSLFGCFRNGDNTCDGGGGSRGGNALGLWVE